MGFLQNRKAFDRSNRELRPLHLRAAIIAKCVIDYPLCLGEWPLINREVQKLACPVLGSVAFFDIKRGCATPYEKEIPL